MCCFNQKLKIDQITSNNGHIYRLQCTDCLRIPAIGSKWLILTKKNLHVILPQKLLSQPHCCVGAMGQFVTKLETAKPGF